MFFIRTFILANVSFALVFVINNFLTHSLGWAGAFQLSFYILALLAVFLWLRRRVMADDVRLLESFNGYLVCATFWVVLLVGLVDAGISFMRVQNLHNILFSEDFANTLNQPALRGKAVHIPVIIAGALVALWKRNVSVIWLTLMVVLAELFIVIARFIFSYEQTFMGDLVRFWYAALFLLASALTLAQDAHVRVDVLYAGLAPNTKARINFWGSMLLGLPLCWVVLWRGLAGKSSLINSPLLNFETSMSGYGLYVKYLMAGFLLMFALTMLLQFSSYILRSTDAGRDEGRG